MKKFVFAVICTVMVQFIYAQGYSASTKVNDDGTVDIKVNSAYDANLEYFLFVHTDYGQNEEQLGQITLVDGKTTAALPQNAVEPILYSIRYTLPDATTESKTLAMAPVVLCSFDALSSTLKWTFDTVTAGTFWFYWQEQTHYIEIYRKRYADNDWALLATLTDDEFVYQYKDESPSGCYTQYKVKIYNKDCVFESNVAEVSKADNDQPQTPAFNHQTNPVTVDVNTQKVIINWQPSTSSDTWGYAVCKTNDNGVREALDTVYGRESTSYTCNKCGKMFVNDITVYAFDSCGNPSTLSDTYRNMVLKSNRESCNEPLKLTWNASCTEIGPESYTVYMAGDDGQYNAVKTVSGTSCTVDVPNADGTVKIFVSYGNAGQDYASNVVEVSTSGADTLDFVYLNDASVDSTNMNVRLEFEADNTKKVQGFELWRSRGDGEYTKVKDIAYNGQSVYTVTDNLEVSAAEYSYTYYVKVPDVCNSGTYSYSNRLTTIKPLIDDSNNDKVKIAWNAFNPKAWTVDHYEVYRYSEGDYADAQLVTQTNTLSYVETSKGFASPTDRTFYYIVAVGDCYTDADGQTVCNQAYSASNFAKFESICFVPNAFAPKDGVHQKLQTFKPECHFIRQGTYSFKVYSRSGQLLFETNNVDEGWNGEYKGVICPVGTYVYKIQYVDSDGMQQNKAGAFLLYD
ncbi:MAG: gliding motility-associated C-terminal domain-containing protein [Bacteroidales bacterium]|nr:gliding motility-associated C-terminal domain-containing protein [Bacteroidales bacterium]